MRYWILLFLFVHAAVSFGQNNEIKKTDLLGCWTDSREENPQGSETRIYRPCDFKSFPISRFRFVMNLEDEGKCTWLYLSPTDAHHMKDGTWSFDNEGMILKIFDSNRKEVKSFVIAEVGENILRIKN